MSLADEGVGPVPPASTNPDPYWGGVAEAIGQYRPHGESPLAAGLQGFVTAKAASDRLKAGNDDRDYRRARDEEEWNFRKDDRKSAREERAQDRADRAADRALALKDREEDRAIRRDEFGFNKTMREKELGFRQSAEERAQAQEKDRDLMADRQLMVADLGIEKELKSLEAGVPLTPEGAAKIEYSRNMRLESIDANPDYSEEEAKAERSWTNQFFDQMLQRNQDNTDAAADGGNTDVMGKADRPGNPGAIAEGNNEEELGSVPMAGEEEPGFFGRLGNFVTTGEPMYDVGGALFGEGEAAPEGSGFSGSALPGMGPTSDPQGRKASDIFAKPPENLSGDGTKENPLVGFDGPQEQVLQQIMHLPPGSYFVYQGQIRGPTKG